MPSDETTAQVREGVSATADKARQQARAAASALDPSGVHTTQAVR
jgi:hypothetical protein